MDTGCTQAPEKDIETLAEGTQSTMGQREAQILEKKPYLPQYKVTTGKVIPSGGGEETKEVWPENEVIRN